MIGEAEVLFEISSAVNCIQTGEFSVNVQYRSLQSQALGKSRNFEFSSVAY